MISKLSSLFFSFLLIILLANIHFFLFHSSFTPLDCTLSFWFHSSSFSSLPLLFRFSAISFFSFSFFCTLWFFFTHIFTLPFNPTLHYSSILLFFLFSHEGVWWPKVSGRWDFEFHSAARPSRRSGRRVLGFHILQVS